jgi:hypothetical protein
MIIFILFYFKNFNYLQLYTGCPVHQTALHFTCNEQVYQFCRSKHVSNDQLFSDGNQDLHSNDIEKERKKQKNKIKLKCTCELNDKENDNQEIKKLKKLITSNEIYNNGSCEGL